MPVVGSFGSIVLGIVTINGAQHRGVTGGLVFARAAIALGICGLVIFALAAAIYLARQ